MFSYAHPLCFRVEQVPQIILEPVNVSGKCFCVNCVVSVNFYLFCVMLSAASTTQQLGNKIHTLFCVKLTFRMKTFFLEILLSWVT